MTSEEARAHYNFLLTLCIRKAESFGPLAFNFINLHVQLLPDITTAIVPANTLIFSLYPVMARGNVQLEDARSLTARPTNF
jgi:hypothetical protein